MISTSRRGFLVGLGAAVAAPAVIRTPGLLMPVRSILIDQPPFETFAAYRAAVLQRIADGCGMTYEQMTVDWWRFLDRTSWRLAGRFS